MSDVLVSVDGVSKSYGEGDRRVDALIDIDLSIAPGTLVVVTGRSGSGKTTLLNVLGGLDEPTSGTVTIDDVPLSTLPDDETLPDDAVSDTVPPDD